MREGENVLKKSYDQNVLHRKVAEVCELEGIPYTRNVKKLIRHLGKKGLLIIKINRTNASTQTSTVKAETFCRRFNKKE